MSPWWGIGHVSIIHRQGGELGGGEDGTFLPDIDGAEVAAPALAYASLRTVLERRVDLLEGEVHLGEGGEGVS